MDLIQHLLALRAGYFLSRLDPHGRGLKTPQRWIIFITAAYLKKNLSIGGSFFNNKVFIDERTLYSIDAAYLLQLGQGKSLSLGLKAGAHTKFTDVNEIQRLINTPNKAIPEIIKETYPLLGFGFLYTTQRFYMALSVPNFLNPIKYTDNQSFISDEKPSTYFVAGYKISSGILNSFFNPFFSSKIIPGIGQQILKDPTQFIR